MTRILTLLVLLLPVSALAQNISLPNNYSASAYDEIRTQSGTTCKQAIGSPLNVEFGVVGSDSDESSKFNRPIENWQAGSQGSAVYGRISYALGTKPRLDCSRVLELEIQTLKEELMLLRNSYELD